MVPLSLKEVFKVKYLIGIIMASQAHKSSQSLTESTVSLVVIFQVFDLADRNIWLRRQMIIVLRQIVKTMFGDTVNKRIVDYFASLTSVDAVSGYLNNIKVHLLMITKKKMCCGPDRSFFF